MNKNHFKVFFWDYFVGFFAYVIVSALIFLALKPHAFVIFVWLMIWTFLWLIAYVDFVSKKAVELYQEHVYKENFAITEQLNKDTDIFLGIRER